MSFTIKNPPGARHSEEMRALFEKSIKSTAAFARNTPLGAMTINGEFQHYCNPDTDTMWLGFAIGMRCADRLAKATQPTGPQS